jgi:hypothetical protein
VSVLSQHIPDDLVPIDDVAVLFPRHTADDLVRMSRRGTFCDTMKVGAVWYVRQQDLDLWARGCWHSEKQRIGQAAVATTLPFNRRSQKRRA